MNIAQLFSAPVDNSIGIILMIVAEFISLAYFMIRSKAAKQQQAAE
jgi:preprotein translocase subunit YajC